MLNLFFYGESLKKRLPRTLLIILAFAAACVIIKYFVGDHLGYEHAKGLLFITLFAGILFTIFYLLTGIFGALAIVAFMCVSIGVRTLPSPWDMLLAAVLIAAIPVWNLVKKRRARADLLKNIPDISELEAAEIVNTVGGISTSLHDAMRQEGNAILETGCLMVTDPSMRSFRRYILRIREGRIALHHLDKPERIRDALLGEDVERSEKDITLPLDGLERIVLTARHIRGASDLQISIRHAVKTITLSIIGNFQVPDIIEFFDRYDIRVENRVTREPKAIPQADAIVREVMDADTETLRRRKKARITNKLLGCLSFLSLALCFLWVLFRPLSIVLLIVPIFVSVFYVRFQDCVLMDGSRTGKPSAFFPYLINPVFSALFLWCVLLEFHFVFHGGVLFYLIPGLAVTALAMAAMLKTVREFRHKRLAKAGVFFLAAAHGYQTAIVLGLLTGRICR